MEKILIVEDDRATRKALQQLFEGEGFAAVTAATGVEGLAAYRQSRPSFVMLDLKMPQLSGQELCRQIRRESEDVPIIILTASADEISRVLLLELGADDYVTKPFSPKELLARVRAVLRRARRSAPVEQLYFDDVAVDFARMEATKGNHPVALTPQEFKLLRYFAQYPQRVISREQLLNDVWGYQSYPSTRTVDSHILTLRQKLEREPGSPVHFVTIHNAGYKFVP
jgi:DNA-binding response OmpR family regulator